MHINSITVKDEKIKYSFVETDAQEVEWIRMICNVFVR